MDHCVDDCLEPGLVWDERLVCEEPVWPQRATPWLPLIDEISRSEDLGGERTLESLVMHELLA
jgi:hypothetical protein